MSRLCLIMLNWPNTIYRNSNLHKHACTCRQTPSDTQSRLYVHVCSFILISSRVTGIDVSELETITTFERMCIVLTVRHNCTSTYCIRRGCFIVCLYFYDKYILRKLHVTMKQQNKGIVLGFTPSVKNHNSCIRLGK